MARLTITEAKALPGEIDNLKNLAFLTCITFKVSQKFSPTASIHLNDNHSTVQIYEASTHNACYGVVHNIEPGTKTEELMRKLEVPKFKILIARIMGRTAVAILTFEGSSLAVEYTAATRTTLASSSALHASAQAITPMSAQTPTGPTAETAHRSPIWRKNMSACHAVLIAIGTIQLMTRIAKFVVPRTRQCGRPCT